MDSDLFLFGGGGIFKRNGSTLTSLSVYLLLIYSLFVSAPELLIEISQTCPCSLYTAPAQLQLLSPVKMQSQHVQFEGLISTTENKFLN